MAEANENNDPAATQKVNMDELYAEADERSMDRLTRDLDLKIKNQTQSNERMNLTDEQLDA